MTASSMTTRDGETAPGPGWAHLRAQLRLAWPWMLLFALSLPAVTTRIYASDEVQYFAFLRSMWFDQTGLPWVNPSPNMRSPVEALLYPGIGLLETTNLSVGRGTEIPFEVIGAPWLDGAQLAEKLHALRLPGVDFVPIVFTPAASKFSGQRCCGVRILLTHRDAYRSVPTGLHIACQLRRLHRDAWKAADYLTLLGHRGVLDALLDGRPVDEWEAIAAPGLEAFRQRRARFLLYE